MSESCQNQEKDVTLNSTPQAQEVLESTVSATADTITDELASDERAVGAADSKAKTKKYADFNKEQIADAIESLIEKDVEESKDDISYLKQLFYQIRKKEIEAEKQVFLEKGNEESAFAPMDDNLEIKVKDLLASYKEKRITHIAALEQKRKDNLEIKHKIIDELKAIVADTDNINKHYNKFQQLQQEFRAVGDIPAENVTDMWKIYQVVTENFYDLLKINKDLRDYDFKKNLEIKQNLCIMAQALDKEDDVIFAFKKLQDLHNQWRETGPVSKELREDLWTQFKDASASVNKKYQSFFESRKEKEKENEDAKNAICEKIEAMDLDTIKNYSGWDEATKTVIMLQEEWKTLGFASRKVNNAIFTRFRKSCDAFFARKAEFYKVMKDELTINLDKKIALCEKAEALQESTNWKETTEAMIALQKEWKTIGPVIKKQSDIVWKRFISACDKFFEEKGKQTSSVRQVEHTNLKAKKDIIAELKALIAAEPNEESGKTVRELMKQWRGIGHVPFKEKDKIYTEYQNAITEAFEKFDIKENRAKMHNFESNLDQISSDSDKLYRERERFERAYEIKRNELKTYENNLGFFNAKSKSGNTMLKEMERKIEKIKEDLSVIEKKIEIIDSKL